MSLLKLLLSVCPGDEGRPPVVPLPPLPVPHLGRPLALLPVRAAPGAAAGGETGGARGLRRGRGGVPDPIPGVEEGPDPGGDGTGHDRGPTTETEREKGTGTGTETGTGGDTQLAGERGWTPQRLPAVSYLHHIQQHPDVCVYFLSRSRSSSRQGGSLRRGGRSSGSHRRGDSDSRSPSQSPSRMNHSPSPVHRGAQASTTTVCDKLRK